VINTAKAREEIKEYTVPLDCNMEDLLNEIDRMRNAITEYITEMDCPAPDMCERVRLRQRLREIAEEKP
jgi:hypothetical protein